MSGSFGPGGKPPVPTDWDKPKPTEPNYGGTPGDLFPPKPPGYGDEWDWYQDPETGEWKLTLKTNVPAGPPGGNDAGGFLPLPHPNPSPTPPPPDEPLAPEVPVNPLDPPINPLPPPPAAPPPDPKGEMPGWIKPLLPLLGGGGGTSHTNVTGGDPGNLPFAPNFGAGDPGGGYQPVQTGTKYEGWNPQGFHGWGGQTRPQDVITPMGYGPGSGAPPPPPGGGGGGGGGMIPWPGPGGTGGGDPPYTPNPGIPMPPGGSGPSPPPGDPKNGGMTGYDPTTPFTPNPGIPMPGNDARGMSQFAGGQMDQGGYDPTDPYNVYLSSVPVMEREAKRQVQDRIGQIAPGNALSTSAKRIAADVGAGTALQQNQMFNDLMYKHAQANEDRALQSSLAGMGFAGSDFDRAQKGAQLAGGFAGQDLDRMLAAAQAGTGLGATQDEIERNRIKDLMGAGAFETGRADDFSKMAYNDFMQSRRGYLPEMLGLGGGVGQGSQAGGIGSQTAGKPGLLDYGMSTAPYWGQWMGK